MTLYDIFVQSEKASFPNSRPTVLIVHDLLFIVKLMIFQGVVKKLK